MKIAAVFTDSEAELRKTATHHIESYAIGFGIAISTDYKSAIGYKQTECRCPFFIAALPLCATNLNAPKL